jgi:hypothetical protein
MARLVAFVCVDKYDEQSSSSLLARGNAVGVEKSAVTEKNELGSSASRPSRSRPQRGHNHFFCHNAPNGQTPRQHHLPLPVVVVVFVADISLIVHIAKKDKPTYIHPVLSHHGTFDIDVVCAKSLVADGGSRLSLKNAFRIPFGPRGRST